MFNYRAFILWFMVISFIVVVFFKLDQAYGQTGHRPQDMELHQKFYSTWYAPNNGHERTASCCNKIDCEPRKVKRENGEWWVWWRLENKWIPIPDKIIESNQLDPRESPDGQSHVCINPNSGIVLCAVLGSGE